MTAARAARPRTGLVWLGLAAGALLAVGAADTLADRWRGRAAPAPPPRVAAGHDADYARSLSALDAAVAGAAERTERDPESWLARESLGRALMQRARLTGGYDDLAAADRAMERACALAPDCLGPNLSRALMHLAAHRIGAAEGELARIGTYAIPPSPAERAEIDALRGDIAFYRGRLADAAAIYGRAARAGADIDWRMALVHLARGEHDAAAAAFDRAGRSARLPTRRLLAELALRRGQVALAAGDWPGAEAAVRAADALYPGSWLIRAHLAQADALAGRTAAAEAGFAAAARAGSPEAMDAIAALRRARGDTAGAARWAGRAGAIWSRRLAQLPEAALGHAAEHELAFGDPARALMLARRDHALRPHGATATMLAWAELANGRPAAALGALRPALAAGWRSADAYLAQAQAHDRLGDARAADAARAAATAIDPRALDPRRAFIWFH